MSCFYTLAIWLCLWIMSCPCCICSVSFSDDYMDIDVPMCNDGDTLPGIDGLTPTDLLRIKSLEQLHVLSRHGSRVGDRSVSSIFPNIDSSLPNTKWICNFTTVTASDYDDYNWISLQKNYVEDEQITGGNCKDSQSIYKAVRQHKLNAHLIRQYYIGDKHYHLMTQREFERIIREIFIDQKYTDNNTPFIKIISTDLERCFTSVSVFMTHLLEMEYGPFTTPMDRYLYTYTHDEKRDPYTPQKNANCPKLNAWMKSVQSTAPLFSEWLASQEVQSFYNRFETEVGYNLNGDQDAYKICSNVVWMYCAGIDLIPNALSPALFAEIHNFTLEYRRRLLHSGEPSVTTTTLATMPFAWILRTLIGDFVKHLQGGLEDDINGYMKARRAKIVFHSTRGISTLLMLEPLGLSNGVQPIYANLVNLEIYSRVEEDAAKYTKYEAKRDEKYGYERYLFRFTFMGQFVPFPGCESDYQRGQSTLCNLEVLMERLREYALHLVEWEPYCRNVTESYFTVRSEAERSQIQSLTNEKREEGMHTRASKEMQLHAWYMVVGILLGGVAVWCIDRRHLKWHTYEALQ